MYPDVLLSINGAWAKAAEGRTIPVVNPATEEKMGALRPNSAHRVLRRA